MPKRRALSGANWPLRNLLAKLVEDAAVFVRLGWRRFARRDALLQGNGIVNAGAWLAIFFGWHRRLIVVGGFRMSAGTCGCCQIGLVQKKRVVKSLRIWLPPASLSKCGSNRPKTSRSKLTDPGEYHQKFRRIPRRPRPDAYFMPYVHCSSTLVSFDAPHLFHFVT